MLKLLWPQSDTSRLDQSGSKHGEINIPTYNQGSTEDSIDLQIKSLLYIYKKFRIPKLDHFVITSDDTNDKFVDFTYIDDNYDQTPSSAGMIRKRSEFLINDKLDLIYNVTYFKSLFLDDPYRVLIDFPKNKFRSLMILSDDPKDVSLPSLNDDFKFLVLHADSADEEYKDVLLNSPIYKEHSIKPEIKLSILNKILGKQREQNPNGFTRDDRCQIIRLYLIKLGYHIQVGRICKSMLLGSPSDQLEEDSYNSAKNSVRIRIERESIKTTKH